MWYLIIDKLINWYLQGGVEVDDLYEDLKDGLKLIALLENLSKKPIVSFKSLTHVRFTIGTSLISIIMLNVAQTYFPALLPT